MNDDFFLHLSIADWIALASLVVPGAIVMLLYAWLYGD